MSSVVALARAKRRILLPFSAGINTIIIAALLWLDARESPALEYDGESFGAPSHGSADEIQSATRLAPYRNAMMQQHLPIGDPSDADADPTPLHDGVKFRPAKPSGADTKASANAHHVQATVVKSSAYPQILAGPSHANAIVDAITAGPDTSKPVLDNAAAGFSSSQNSNLIVLSAAVTDPADTLQTDTTAPVVTSVVTSGAGIGGGDGDLNAGRVVTLTVSMSEAVTVGGGTPTLSLNNGGTAHYTGGSGTDALTFGYAVGAGQDTADLMVTSLNLNGATLRDVANNGANLSGAAINPAATPQIDTTAPAVPTITSIAQGGAGGNHWA